VKTKTNHEPEQTIHDRQALALTVANEIRRVPYSKRAQPSVIDVMELHKALKNAESDCDRRKRELGEARIGEALGKWTVLSGRSTLSFGTNTVPDIVHEHPKIDPDVSQWLECVANQENLSDETFDRIGRIICQALYQSDVSFFDSLLRTFKNYDPTLNRTQVLKQHLLLEKLFAGGAQLIFRSYYELTRIMRDRLSRPKLQLGYALRRH